MRTVDLFTAGAEGPVTTMRFENTREGIQEAEVRIFIEKALLDKQHPLPAKLAQKCQELLDERTNDLRMGEWLLLCPKDISPDCVGWREKNRGLFEAAAEVAKSLAK